MSEKLIDIFYLILQNRFIFTLIQKIKLVNLIQLTILKILTNRNIVILGSNILKLITILMI
jgi:hypothetical protein